MEELQKYHSQVKKIIKEIHPNYKDHIADVVAQEIIDSWIPELEQNFFEWINKEPLSEIKVYDLSLNDFFRAWNKSVYNSSYMDIQLALIHINKYKNVPESRREHYKYTVLNIHKMTVL